MFYTNSNDEKVELSTEHVDISIKLYDELKKQSPSGRVSWSKHKQMMELEGFYDSEVSERYRVAIKNERYRRNSMPNISTYTQYVSDTKIESLKQAIGELRHSQLEAQQDFLSLNRLKREISKDVILAEIIGEKIGEIDWSDFNGLKTPIINTNMDKKQAIVAISDFHYGYQGENELNEYNPVIAEHLLVNVYADKLINLFKVENVTNVHVINLGDLVEGNLRNQSLFDTQKTLSEQAVEATDIIVKFLVKLSKYVNIAYSGIVGNHDRLTPNVKEALSGDSVMYLSNTIIEKLSQHIGIEYKSLESEYYGVVEMSGRKILVVHGDRTSVFKDSVLAEQSLMLNKKLDLIIAGHYHRHNVREVADDKYVAIFGSIKGIDDYSIRIGKTSCRSQGVVIFDSKGEMDIRQIKL
ncbi:metallophosphoesterase family protein [Aerococcaceae bacterium zg-B36]|uniref:metallophosphoesterase n=1 Tax=Aerococcaceae bacterium zg-252 TaxID=2796928 RepID=UPI001BD8AA48|nr:metallophosphoesterase family protein [Aerococcaceae bacterium zg-B36]